MNLSSFRESAIELILQLLTVLGLCPSILCVGGVVMLRDVLLAILELKKGYVSRLCATCVVFAWCFCGVCVIFVWYEPLHSVLRDVLLARAEQGS